MHAVQLLPFFFFFFLHLFKDVHTNVGRQRDVILMGVDD